jgi:hypothetical protein|tara:strand:- start:1240 stop:5433 length:4194 start_codon:yes stop_codon:yes gene_type:complete
MASSRQNNLFAAEDWKVAYKAYSKVDFQAYDFDTMRSAMVDYIRTNYPENFNDFIESSEFVSIIELLAFLSQSLAFRMDVNTRENFLETAERRDSVFKLARMLGYNPKRNLPASGLLKLVSVRTSEPLTDSLGTSLSNKTIYWDDSNNSQSYEQFITVMNAAMSRTNQFTAPIKSGTVGNIPTELYQLNSPINSPIVHNVNITSTGTKRQFNVVNADFKDNSHFYERDPSPTNLQNIIYRNDGGGLAGKNTGFFALIKQGNLQFKDYNYTSPIENRIEQITVPNINETDVYIQEIDTNGFVLNNWTKIPNTVGQTLNYNSKSLNTRNLYSVENQGADGIRIRFPDGNFGNVPVGIFRVWYRTSDASTYTINPEEAKNLSITVPYENVAGRSYSVSLTFSLQYAINNSTPAESLAAIKERAPQVFYTQNRMVSAQDYNVFPQSQSTNIAKIKATNRTHSGHSRYIDINDPTGSYHNVDTFADDAYIYNDIHTASQQVIVNNTTTPTEVVLSVITNILKLRKVNDFTYYGMRAEWKNPTKPSGSLANFNFTNSDNVTWNAQPVKPESKTGYITEEFTPGTTNVLVNNSAVATANKAKGLKDNTFIKWVDPTNPTSYKWARITSIENNGVLSSAISTALGPWALSEEIPAGWEIRDFIVSLRKLFTTEEFNSIVAEITAQRTFAIGYHLQDDYWYVIPNSDLTTSAKTGEFGLDSTGKGPNSWLLLMDYSPIDSNNYKYNITYRCLDYIVQSEGSLKFYNINNLNESNANNRTSKDTIVFTTVNTKPGAYENYAWGGSTWTNEELGLTITPVNRVTDIPLRTRSTTWHDVAVNWISNFGILKTQVDAPDAAKTNQQLYAEHNEYVTDAIVPLNTYHSVGGVSTSTNVVLANNTGRITSLPSKIVIPFNNTTFGSNFVDNTGATPFITYRQIVANQGVGSEVIWKAELANVTVSSYGANGDAFDNTVTGRLHFKTYNAATGIGSLEYTNVQENDLHFSKDRTATFSQDKLEVYYENNKEKLDQEITWEVLETYKETDGYTDPRKVRVAPISSNGDLVPDRPLQFEEFVDSTDEVYFEYYTDFDGYRYDRPASGIILDYRNEDELTVDNTGDRITPTRYDDWKKLSTVKWFIVKNKIVAESLQNKTNAKGAVIFVVNEFKTYQLLAVGTANEIKLVETKDYFVKRGRGKTQNTDSTSINPGTIKWKHIAPNDVRIDPSISNVVEMLVLTNAYNLEVTKWLARPTAAFPASPTSDQLGSEFAGLNTYKSASDTLVFRSAKFKLLFGNQADDTVKAKFRVVKLSNQFSDNELKSRIVALINSYFSVTNWEFGETFYFTELSTYIHQELGSSIGSIVILPKNTTGKFGEMFQVKAESNELFLSTASVSDIEIIGRLDNQTLRTDR